MDAMDRFGQELLLAGARRHASRRAPIRARFARMSPERRAPAHVRVALIVLALLLATAAITLAATGVILTGPPVGTVRAPVATAGEGIPVPGGARLLPLRVADPAGGLPWGMRIIHTTRGLICVQLGRVNGDQLGQLGVDGAFHDDGLFHPLPVDALPDVLGRDAGWMAGNCSSPGDIYAGDSVGLRVSASAGSNKSGASPADIREISFGLLGVHAVSVTYREGSQTHTRPVLPGSGAYLVVQRYNSGRPLGSVSETDGRDELGNFSSPAAPNGALTAITYSYSGRPCVDRGRLREASCGLSEVPPPRPTPLPIVHASLYTKLEIHHGEITGAQISFNAPYAVTNANENYSVSAPVCHGGLAGSGSDTDLARGAPVTIHVGDVLSDACSRTVRFIVEYVSFTHGLPQPTRLGTVVIHEPPGTHPKPLPPRVLEQQLRSNPTRSLHAPVHLSLLPQSRAGCDAAFLLYPCYRSAVTFTAPYAATSAGVEYSIESYGACKIGGRPDRNQTVNRKVRAHETVTATSLGLFVVPRSCASTEGFRVAFLNHDRPSADAPHDSVVVGAVALRETFGSARR